jgi:hypothetical protein
MKKALLVGINYHDTDYKLLGCINDVVNLKSLFVSQMGYKDDLVEVRDECNTRLRVTETKTRVFTVDI